MTRRPSGWSSQDRGACPPSPATTRRSSPVGVARSCRPGRLARLVRSPARCDGSGCACPPSRADDERPRLQPAHQVVDRARPATASRRRRRPSSSFGGVGHASLSSCGVSTARPAASASTAVEQQAGAELAPGRARPRRWCRPARSARRTRRQHRAGVERLDDPHDRDAGLASPAMTARCTGAAPR